MIKTSNAVSTDECITIKAAGANSFSRETSQTALMQTCRRHSVHHCVSHLCFETDYLIRYSSSTDHTTWSTRDKRTVYFY